MHHVIGETFFNYPQKLKLQVGAVRASEGAVPFLFFIKLSQIKATVVPQVSIAMLMPACSPHWCKYLNYFIEEPDSIPRNHEYAHKRDFQSHASVPNEIKRYTYTHIYIIANNS